MTTFNTDFCSGMAEGSGMGDSDGWARCSKHSAIQSSIYRKLTLIS